MKFTQYYLDCLSQASYLIGDEATGRAAVVDPRRDIEEYLADAVIACHEPRQSIRLTHSAENRRTGRTSHELATL